MIGRCTRPYASESLLGITIPLILAVSLGAQPPDGRAPVPAGEDQQRATALVREVYGKEYDQAQTDAARVALARKLVDQAKRADQDPAGRFVLLQTARDVAVLAGSSPMALEAAREIARAFRVDLVEMEIEVIGKTAKAVRTPAQNKALAEDALRVTEELLTAERYDDALGLAKTSLAAGRKARDAAIRRRVDSRCSEVAELASGYAQVKEALAALDKRPGDPGANLTAGRFYSFFKADWPKGIPMLALGSDAALQSLAVKELKMPSSSTEEMTLADAWWELAEKEKGLAQANLRAHAAAWYQRALPSRSGLEKTKIEKRLAEVPRPLPGIHFMPGSAAAVGEALTTQLNDFAQWKVTEGKWTSQDGKITGAGPSSLSFGKELPADFTLEFKMNALSGMRPRVHFKGFYVGNEGYSKAIFIHPQAKGTPVAYENNQEMQVRVRVQDGDVELHVSDKSIATATIKPGEAQSLSIHGGDGWSPGSTAFSEFKLTVRAKSVK